MIVVELGALWRKDSLFLMPVDWEKTLRFFRAAWRLRMVVILILCCLRMLGSGLLRSRMVPDSNSGVTGALNTIAERRKLITNAPSITIIPPRRRFPIFPLSIKVFLSDCFSITRSAKKFLPQFSFVLKKNPSRLGQAIKRKWSKENLRVIFHYPPSREIIICLSIWWGEKKCLKHCRKCHKRSLSSIYFFNK